MNIETLAKALDREAFTCRDPVRYELLGAARDEARAAVRAVLEAIRPADQEILEAGAASFGDCSVSTHDGRGSILPEFVIHPWQAMIDSILTS